MRRIGKIILTLLMMFVLAGSWIVAVNWNTFSAFYDSYRYTEEELQQQQEKNKEELQAYLDDNEDIVVRDMTEEEKEAYNSGKIDEQQLQDILTGKTTLEAEFKKNGYGPDGEKVEKEDGKETEPTKPQSAGNNPGKPPESAPAPSGGQGEKKPTVSASETDQKISEYIAQLYICKNDFMTKLANLEQMIQDEFYALPQSEWNIPNKQRIITSYIGKVGQWEKDCDTKVYAILDQIKDTLIAADRDTEIVNKIEENYLNEKRIKKAEYMHIYTRQSKEE